MTFTAVAYLGVVVTLFATLFLTTIGSVADSDSTHQFLLALGVGCALLASGICLSFVGYYADDVLGRMQPSTHSPRLADGTHRTLVPTGRARWRELAAVTHAAYAMAHSPPHSDTVPSSKTRDDGERGADEALHPSGTSDHASHQIATKAPSVSFAC